MAPEPRHRQLLSQFLDALRETTSKSTEDEDDERRNLRNDRAYDAVIQARIINLKRDTNMLHAAAELLKEQETTFKRLNAYARNATQPIFRVPDEVLSNIFEAGIPCSSDHWDPGWNPRLARTVQLTPAQYMSQLASIGATCSRFREVVVNTPRCWSYVTFIASGQGTRLIALETMLARSKSCMFTLRLELRGEHFLPSKYTRRAISSILLPHMNRCRALFFTSQHSLGVIPCTMPMTPLKNVRHITFDWNYATDLDSDNEDGVQATLQQNAEETVRSVIAAATEPLRSIAMGGSRHASYAMRRNFEGVHAQCLTRLRLNVCAPLAHVVQLLQRCVLLEHLDWTVNPERDDTTSYTLALENLISLRISNKIGFGDIWNLNAPRLEQIDMSEAYKNLPLDIVDPSQPVLPSLTRVALTESSESRHLAPFLLRHPQLTECVLSLDEFSNDDVDNICGALECLMTPSPESRSIHGRHLQHLSLVFDSENSAQNRDQIRCSWELVMAELTELHVDVHGVQPSIPADARVGARLSFNPPASLQSRWPNAWGDF